MATLEFTKMQGCGNDYIYVVATRARPADPTALSARLSDRHFGIGGDGLILLAPSRTGDLRMEMYNADGSRGDMCGNGIRCLARLAYERAIVRKNPMTIETDAGLKTVELKFTDGAISGATVDMGEPILEGRQIPTDADGRIVDYALEVAGRRERITAVSMGNPHCVVFVTDDAVHKMDSPRFCGAGQAVRASPVLPAPRQYRIHSAGLAPASENAGVGARLGRDARMRHGSVRGGGRGGADRACGAGGDDRAARGKSGNRMA